MQRTKDCTEEGVEGARLKGLAQRARVRVRLLHTSGRRVYVCFTCSLHATAYTPPPWKHSPLQLHSVSATSLQRPRPTTRPSLPPRPKIRSFGHGPSCPSCACTPSSCGCLCCRLCPPPRSPRVDPPRLPLKAPSPANKEGRVRGTGWPNGSAWHGTGAAVGPPPSPHAPRTGCSLQPTQRTDGAAEEHA